MTYLEGTSDTVSILGYLQDEMAMKHNLCFLDVCMCRYKPVELKYIFGPLREEFETIFARTFNKESNRKFLDHVMTSFANKQWTVLVKLLMHVQRSAILRHDKLKDHPDLLQRYVSRKAKLLWQDTYNKFKYKHIMVLLFRWINLGNKLSRVDVQLNQDTRVLLRFLLLKER